MTSELAISKLKQFESSRDNERVHARADEILVSYLVSLGGEHEQVAIAYSNLQNKIEFWYA